MPEQQIRDPSDLYENTLGNILKHALIQLEMCDDDCY